MTGYPPDQVPSPVKPSHARNRPPEGVRPTFAAGTESPSTRGRQRPTMRLLGYLTSAPCNAAAAEALAAAHDMAVRIVEPRDLPRLEREPIDLVVDWDFSPADSRAKVLNGTAVNVVAVHGYGVSDSL